MAKYAVEVSAVTKTYGEETVLDDVSFCLEEGSIVGLVGRNGSGKTMLLRALCGVVAVEGRIVVAEREVAGPAYVNPEVGAVIEAPGFLPRRSGFDNLWALARINRRATKGDVRAALETVGLDARSGKPVRTYSLGMRQRLGLAQAFMEHQRVLFLDEPFNGLDERGVREMRELFKRFRDEGRTLLLATHNADDVSTLCDGVMRMSSGRLSVEL
ncbi:MAG: ATP-binding cassette domain-containing protein [Adlercreutzia sp.]|nr:ATP-binding cassette domain-containing protein [Adlercreutzia sp.]